MIRRSPKEIKEFLKEKQYLFDTPQCYLGQEPNTFWKDWDKARLKILLATCWRYEDFRGNQTVPLLYQMINEHYEDIVCERAHFPNTEKEYKLFRDYKIPIFGLESKHSMCDYDIIMTSLSFLPPWFNFPLMLEMSGIPVLWKERAQTGGKYPLIMIGGSAMYGNFSIAYPVVDMIYLGDAEDEEDGGLLQLLDAIMQDGRLDSLQKQFDYIFCPSLYAPKYNNASKFIGWESKGDYPAKLRRRTCKNLDEAPMYTKPIPSYMDATMGLGEIEISRGCRGMCSFCGIGWKYRPYRERSKDVMVKALKENRHEGGAPTFCPIATEFAYYSQKRGLVKDLLEITPYVDPLSMRVDAFAGDPTLDVILAEAGMNQLALGVEGISQRIRNRMLKGITEDDILTACQIAVDSGRFRRIKFFMISNVDEEWEDWEEFFELLTKVDRMRRKSGIQIKASWTPLFVEPCTPLQWKKPTIEQRQDWTKICKVMKELKVEVAFRSLRIKSKPDFLWLMQGMHLGDTRFAEAVAKASEEFKHPFYVTFTPGTLDVVTKWMTKMNRCWGDVIRERREDEKFPWDIVDRGVKKTALRKIYDKIISGEYDDKTIIVESPIEDCDMTGVGEKARLARIKPEYWSILKYSVGGEFNIVPNTHWKAQIQRAGYKSGVPIVISQIRFFSDRANKNWYEGCDYCVVGSEYPLGEGDIAKLNRWLCGMQIIDIRGGLRKIQGTWKKFISLYAVETDEFSSEEMLKYEMDFVKAEEVIVSNPETRYFSGAWKKKVDLKSLSIQIIYDNEFLGGRIMSIWLDHQVAIRAFLKGFFHDISSQRVSQLKVQKMMLGERRVYEIEEIF